MRGQSAIMSACLMASCSAGASGPSNRHFLVIDELSSAKTNELVLEVAHLKDSRLPCIPSPDHPREQQIEARFEALLPRLSAHFGTNLEDGFEPSEAPLSRLCREQGVEALATYEAVVGELERRFPADREGPR